MESLGQLEVLCERLYTSQDSTERAHAERTLKCFSTSTDYISQCQYILDNASTSYALMMASSSLLKQVTDHNLPLQLRLDIRNYLISYLATRGAKLEPFVLGSLVQLFCRITKFGWFDDKRFKEVVKETMNFLSQGPNHSAIGLKILNQLISEMNQPHPGLPASRQRRIASCFSDQLLLQIFQISISSLDQVKNDVSILTKDSVGSKMQELAISLSLSCLSFDFLGTSFDESSDEIGTIQIPISWRPILEDPSTLQIFFDYYAITQSHFSKEALECLVHLASVRRSLFTSESSRVKFLSQLMMGSKEILQTGKGLSNHDNYHVFCRLLARFKSNFQLTELTNAEGYSDWICLTAEFTMKSLCSWQWASSSVYYVLGLWSKLVASVPYFKGDKPNMLDKYVPTIIECFVSTRFESLQSELSDELSENSLDNVDLLQDHLDFFPYLCRFQYESCSSYIMKVMEPILHVYMEQANLQACVENNEFCMTEAKLAWIVHIVAAILKTKQISGYSGELQELLDAELSARIFQLINVTDNGAHRQRYGEISKQRLDRSILTFLQHFKRSYIGDQAMHSSKQLFSRLSELLGLHDHLQVLNAVVGKIVTNLKSYAQCKEVIDHTLILFLELTSGRYMTGKLLLKLDTIKFILTHHNKEHFSFLEEPTCFRSRTTFYYTVGLLIFMEDSLPKFRSSMYPLMQVFVSLESAPDAMFRSDVVKYVLIGLMRDLRGIAMATNSRKTYGFLFEWLYLSRTPLLLKGISHWIDVPEVTTPLLKFVAELVMNKSQRLTFDSSSPNALSGSYVNFGVFELYGDRALADALDIALKMVLSIPFSEVLAFPKKLFLTYRFPREIFYC
ncbi:Coatomer beta subunit [Parasponia andersonii]|uniref:Coatomer beta subunit n=1 Tax=Parasponia andersonii TaxID=3476 RepID=A0A2P5E567_PARAD|nr:Coatomer beta subunit [Parasponia andersonii]